MDIDITDVSVLVQRMIIAALNAVNDGISSLVGLLPNPDPFDELLAVGNLTGDPAAVLAFYWLNQFFDVSAIVAVIMTWLGMFALAWLIMMLWRWAKAVR